MQWLSAYYILGRYLNLSNILSSHIFDEKMSGETFLFFKGVVIYMIATQQTNTKNMLKKKPDRNFLIDIINNNSNSIIDTRQIISRIFPEEKKPTSSPENVASGSGLKRGRGLASNMNQLISRTENLIKGAQLGNKTRELFNELDSNLQVLIDKKKITKRYRDDIMKKLFF